MASKKIESFQGDNRWLSNFYPCTVTLEGITYPSTENAYQAMKCENTADRLKFVDIPAGKAKRLGRKIEVRKDWESVKEDVMNQLLAIKFSQDFFKQKLLNTGDAEIQEGNAWGDLFWGVDIITGEGKNKLGKRIMLIRKILREGIANA